MHLAPEGIWVTILIGRGAGPHIGMLGGIIATGLFIWEVRIFGILGTEDLLAILGIGARSQ